MTIISRIFLAAILGGLSTVAPASAAGNLVGCFTRTYDAAHLRLHRDQQVRRLWLRIGPARDGGAEFGMNVWLRGKPQIWRAGGSCDAMAGGWTCRPDTDGASKLSITRAGGRVRIANVGSLKIFDDVTGPDLNDLLIGAPGDASFDLTPAAMSACKDSRS